MSKNSPKLLDEVSIKRINKALLLFSDYLGTPFDELVPIKDMPGHYGLKSTGRATVIFEDDRWMVPFDLASNTTVVSSVIILLFIRHSIICEDSDKRGKIGNEIFLGGIPFNFNMECFVKRYLGKTSAVRLKELLNLIGYNQKTYDPYFSKRTAEFDNDDDLIELIIDIFIREGKDTLSLFKVKKNLGIEKQDLKDFITDKGSPNLLLTDNGTKIFSRNTKTNLNILIQD